MIYTDWMIHDDTVRDMDGEEPNIDTGPVPAMDEQTAVVAGSETSTGGHSGLTERRSNRKRRYEDGCAAAHALDLVGERWALLIVRELLLGPRRFSDLRHALGSISPNVLTQRLADLEIAGVLLRRELPPPAACRVYALTPWGAELESVILELLRWGVRSPGFERGRPLTADAMALSFKIMFRKERALGHARHGSTRVSLVMDRNAYHLAVENGQLAVARGEPPSQPSGSGSWAAATLYAQPVIVLQLAYAKRPLHDAIRKRDCRFEGNETAMARFFTYFEVAPPAG